MNCKNGEPRHGRIYRMHCERDQDSNRDRGLLLSLRSPADFHRVRKGRFVSARAPFGAQRVSFSELGHSEFAAF